MTQQLFAVYSRRDLTAVRELRTDLRKGRYALWVDTDELTPNAPVRTQLANGLSSSDAMILIHSWEWIYDPRFIADDLRLVLDVARSSSSCPPIIGLRADDAPILSEVRSLVWGDC